MCQEDRRKATWLDVVKNPTFYRDALEQKEGFRMTWHDDSDSPHSSQVYCISAFGTLRKLQDRDRIIRDFLGPEFPWIAESENLEWKISLEFQDEELLNERRATPTSIDAFFISDTGVISLEGKFRSDAEKGFGTCSKVKNRECRGYYGPGSNAKVDSRAWCALEEWDKDRSPRLYWAYGKGFFRPEVFQQQTPKDSCPFAGFSYQLMRNFLFAAAYAQRHRLGNFGVIAVSPKWKSTLLLAQIDVFRRQVLRPELAAYLQHKTYEDYIGILANLHDTDAQGLARFLQERITTLLSGNQCNGTNAMNPPDLQEQVVKTYPPKGNLQLMRLNAATEFNCSRCKTTKKAKLVAIADGDWNQLLCNGCYGKLLSE